MLTANIELITLSKRSHINQNNRLIFKALFQFIRLNNWYSNRFRELFDSCAGKPADPDGSGGKRKGVDHQHLSGKQVACSGYVFDDLVRLHTTDDAGQRRDHPAFAAVWYLRGINFREQVPVIR